MTNSTQAPATNPVENIMAPGSMPEPKKVVLDVKNLNVDFRIEEGIFRAVNGVDILVEEGKTLAIVGESGSGKSVTVRAMLNILATNGIATADRINYKGTELQSLSKKEIRKITGKNISMIFQNPLQALNPSFTIEWQICEVLKTHTNLRSREELRARTLELLEMVEIPDPIKRLNAYPHQLSGGMCQRVVIAMSLSCNPSLIISDEPTTALDVTVQRQIMKLLHDRQQEQNVAHILITHDLGLVSENSDDVMVMYAGNVVEKGIVPDIFENPRHPYTKALLKSLPENATEDGLSSIEGVVPGKYNRPRGCLFAPRCLKAKPECIENSPKLERISGESVVACFFPEEVIEAPKEQKEAKETKKAQKGGKNGSNK